MTGFVRTNEIKRSVKNLTTRIMDSETFNAIVGPLIANNLLGCVPYMIAGVSIITFRQLDRTSVLGFPPCPGSLLVQSRKPYLY
jgi:hypothetical protein